MQNYNDNVGEPQQQVILEEILEFDYYTSSKAQF